MYRFNFSVSKSSQQPNITNEVLSRHRWAQYSYVLLLTLFSISANALNISGIVINVDSTPLAHVLVRLSSTGDSAKTNANGDWHISTSLQSKKNSGRNAKHHKTIIVANQRLTPTFCGVNILGRPYSESAPTSQIGIQANRANSIYVDTITYSYNGSIFLRDTISTSTSSIKRIYDTSWNPAVIYGYLTDKRDAQTYRTVMIGTQTWMAQNLNYNFRGDCPNTEGLTTSGPMDSCKKYGRLYKWTDAMLDANSSNTNPSGIKGLCPVGWHIPSDAEWQQMEMAIGATNVRAGAFGNIGTDQGTMLKSRSGWMISNTGGTDAYGFKALPAGFRILGSNFTGKGTTASWWTTTVDTTLGVIRHGLEHDLPKIWYFPTYRDNSISIRCILN